MNIAKTALVSMLLAAAATATSAFTVNQGQELVIDFHLPPSASPLLALYPTDTAYLAIELSATGPAQTGIASLYSGTELLGANAATRSRAGAASFYFHWTATGSAFSLPDATRIDGSALRNRSIAGQIRTTFDGTLSFDTLYLDAGNGAGTAIYIEGGTQVVIDNVRVAQISAVPEPASAMLLIGGLFVLGAGTAGRGIKSPPKA